MGDRGPVPKGYTRRRNKPYSSGTSVMVERPAMPRTLPEEAKAEWRRVVPVLEEIGLLATIDRGVLIRYCQAWSDWCEFARLLEKSGKLIRGHGMKTVPVIFVDLSVEQARLLNVALNQISGEWDEELLARMLADLRPVADLTLTGFSEDELEKLLKSLDVREKRHKPESFDVGVALEAARAATRAKRGELWAMGDHRLLVDDATDTAAVQRLLGDARPAMCFTDPPYNVGLGDHGGQQRGQKKRRIQNDAMSREEWTVFIGAWSKNLIENVDGAIYLCMSTREWGSVSNALAEAGGHWSDTIIWKKDRFVMGRADYQRQYEPIWYGWREGAKHHWCGVRDQGDVWEIDRPSDSEAHPTMKPLALVERAINNSSKPGDIVLDLFMGSGTTLIASERTGRTCYGMELDAHYASVVGVTDFRLSLSAETILAQMVGE